MLALIVISIFGPHAVRWPIAARSASQTLRIALVAQPNSLAPLRATDYNENEYLDEAIFSGL